jgi:hypothetical protein
MPSTKQMIKIYEWKSIEENISRWQTSQADELDREGIPEALTSSDKTPYAATTHHQY